MKKLMFVAALVVAGMVSGKTSNKKLLDLQPQNSMLNFIKLPVVYDWVKVTTSCGKVFYLNGSDYTNCYECLQEDARKFTDAQCGKGEGFEVPF